MYRRDGVWLRSVALCAALGACGDTREGGAPRVPTDAPEVSVDAPRDAAVSALRSGLAMVAETSLPPTQSGTAHLTRLLLREGRLYGANSSAGVMTWRIDARGALTWESSTEPVGAGAPPMGPSPYPRCVSLAAHPSAPWLFCSAADAGISRFDLANPDEPDARTRETLRPEDGLGRPDLYTLDDALLVAGFDRGLLRVPVGSDGALGAAEPTGVRGDVVEIDGDGATLAALERGRGLLSLRAAGRGVTERGALALDGPPLGLRVRGQRAVVALGSSGVWVVDLTDDAPRVLQRVNPPCVATRGDVAGSVLAVACSTGAWLYDLRGATPRVAGFDPARYGSLDVLLRGDGAQLVVADWRHVRVFDVDPAGSALIPDVAQGAFLVPGDDGVVVARNPGDATLTLRLERLGPDPGMGLMRFPVTEAVVAPGATHRFALPAADLAGWYEPSGRSVRLRVYSVEAEPLGRNDLGTIYVYEASARPRDERPVATGERFWSWRARDGAPGPAALPLPGTSQIALLLPDCALQWGAIEDLAWRTRGTPDARAVTVLALAFGREPDASELAATRRRLDASALGVWSIDDYLRARPQGTSTGAFVDERLSARALGGGDFTDLYDLEDGVVRATDRIYRGAWPLR